VLTADPEPFGRSGTDPNAGVRAFDDSAQGVHPKRSHPAWIDDPEAVRAECEALARLMDDPNADQANGEPRTIREAFTGGVHDEQGNVQGVHPAPNADRSPERSPERSTPPNSTNAGERPNAAQANTPKANAATPPEANANGADQANASGANGERKAKRSPDAIGERSPGKVNATARDAGPANATANDDDQADAAKANHGRTSERSADTNGERSDGEANAPEDTGTITKAALITHHYWQSRDLGLDVQGMSRVDIAKELGIPEGTVKRVWNECLKGQRPRIAGAGSGGHSGLERGTT
jgi:hypothetical protein